MRRCGHKLFPSRTCMPVLTPKRLASTDGARIHPRGVVYAATAIGRPRRCGFACCSIVAKQEFKSTCIQEERELLNCCIATLLRLKCFHNSIRNLVCRLLLEKNSIAMRISLVSWLIVLL